MRGRKLRRWEHRMEGECYVGRPLPSRATIADPVLRRARERDRLAIEKFKRELSERSS